MPFVAQQQEKCVACGRIVYLAEKTIIEEKEQKKIYHKTCIRCAFDRCNKVLNMGEFSSLEGTFYCKPHFKQLFASKGNYEEGFGIEKKRTNTVTPASAPSTFVPVDESKPVYEKKETSEATAAKIRSWRQDSDGEVCVVCARNVFPAEKLVVEEKNTKKTYHNSCFKCSQCGIKVDLRNYGSHEGRIYCKPHLKEVVITQSGKSAAVVTEKLSFVPEVKEDRSIQRGETPTHIKEKFKELGTAEKCRACDKSVYATEKIIVDEVRNQVKVQHLYHKACLKCCKCNIQLNSTTYGTLNGAVYCKVHLKQVAVSEPAKSENAYFISPLRTQTEYQPMYENQDDTPQNRDDDDENPTARYDTPQIRDDDAQNESPNRNSVEKPEDEEEERIRQEEEYRRRQEEEELQQREQEERERQEEEERREREREERRQRRESLNSGSSASSSTTDDDGERRKREREERRRRQEEEAAKEQAEQEKKAEERRKRLEALKNL